jgi:hypothetical protein
MVTFRSIVIFMVLAVFLFMGAACSSKEPANQLTGADKENQPAAERTEEQPAAASKERQPGMESKETAAEKAPPAAMPKTLALTGTVEQAGDNIMLVTDLGDYVLSGQDLSAMVGKTINVTGAVEETGGQYTINVVSFSEQQK